MIEHKDKQTSFRIIKTTTKPLSSSIFIFYFPFFSSLYVLPSFGIYTYLFIYKYTSAKKRFEKKYVLFLLYKTAKGTILRERFWWVSKGKKWNLNKYRCYGNYIPSIIIVFTSKHWIKNNNNRKYGNTIETFSQFIYFFYFLY